MAPPAVNRPGLRRLVAAALYLVFARHLPWSPRPGGSLGRSVRGSLAKRMLDRCGNDVNVEHGAWFGTGRGIELGDHSDIGLDCLVMGELTVGANVMMGPRCVLIAVNHRFDDVAVPMNTQGFSAPRRIVIEDDVWLGAGSVVLPGRRIGRGSIVGAGSVVARDIPPMSIASGNPALVRRSRGEAEGAAEPARPPRD